MITELKIVLLRGECGLLLTLSKVRCQTVSFCQGMVVTLEKFYTLNNPLSNARLVMKENGHSVASYNPGDSHLHKLNLI
jgi:hypothetical protein